MTCLLRAFGFKKLLPCECRFKINTKRLGEIMFIYMDDLIILGSIHSDAEWVKEKPSSLFRIKYLGVVRYHLGVSFKQNENVIL